MISKLNEWYASWFWSFNGSNSDFRYYVEAAANLTALCIRCVLSGYLCIDNAFPTQRWIRHVRFAAGKPPDSVELCSSG